MQLIHVSILFSAYQNPGCSVWIIRRLDLDFKSMVAKKLYDVIFDDWSNRRSPRNRCIHSGLWVCSRKCVFSACWHELSKTNAKPMRVRRLFQVDWSWTVTKNSEDFLAIGCVPVTVSRFTSFIEDFVICCCQFTKFSCLRYCFAISPSAKSPCHLGSLAYFAISVFWDGDIPCFLDATFVGCSASSSCERFCECWRLWIFGITCDLL